MRIFLLAGWLSTGWCQKIETESFTEEKKDYKQEFETIDDGEIEDDSFEEDSLSGNETDVSKPESSHKVYLQDPPLL